MTGPLHSDRGRIVAPDLDDRTWQDLVDEMRAPTADKILERMKRLDVRGQSTPAGA